jgi:Helix-turn-helix domain
MDQPTPKPTAPSPSGAMPEEYLTIAEAAARLKVAPKTLRNKMASGVFHKGVHYIRPKGLGTRFKWGAVVAWLEQEEAPLTAEDSIPMARGYLLRACQAPKKVNRAS